MRGDDDLGWGRSAGREGSGGSGGDSPSKVCAGGRALWAVCVDGDGSGPRG